MSKTDAGTAAAQKPNPGLIGRLFAKGFSAMSAAERKEVLADGAITAGIAEYTAKAHELMDGKHSDIDQVEDLWDDGPDAVPRDKHVGGGHSGDHPGDTTITGPGQSASGNGAAKMSTEYSKTAPQGGAQAATERLGEMLTMKSAMKAVLKALDGQSRQAELLTSAVTAMVDDLATVKATIKSIRKAGEKEDEKEDEKTSGHETEEEESDEEAEQEESGSGTEIEIVNELEEEDEAESDEDEDGRKKAAKSRVLAKGRVKLAKGRLAKALDADLDGRPKAAARHRGVAKAHLAKAKDLFATAKAQGPKAVDRLAVLEKAIRTVAKACRSVTENQDKWPASTEKHAGGAAKAVDAAATPTVPNIAQLQQAVKSMQDQIEEANRGLGMFKTNIAGVMNAVGGQSRGSGQPPVVLAKGGKDVAAGEATVRAKIDELMTSGAITRRDAETAEDVLGQVIAISKGFALDPQIPRTRISRMPEPLQQVFSEAA